MSILGNPITLGGGGADLNIDFGSTPPTDTSKLWVPLASKPKSVKVDFRSDVGSITQEHHPVTAANMTNGMSLCETEDYIYVFGGVPSSYQYVSKKVCRINKQTWVQEDITSQITLPAFPGGAAPCVYYNGCIYIISGAESYTTQRYSRNEQVMKVDLSTNTATVLYQKTPTNYNYENWEYADAFLWGDKIVIIGGSPSIYESGQNYRSQCFVRIFDTVSNGLTLYRCPEEQVQPVYYTKNTVVFAKTSNSTALYVFDLNTKEFTNATSASGWLGNAYPYRHWLISNNSYYIKQGDFGSLLQWHPETYTQSLAATLGQPPTTAVIGASYFRNHTSWFGNAGVVYTKFNFELESGVLLVNTDYTDDVWEAVKGKDTSLYACPLAVYLGDENGTAQEQTAYLYDTTDNKWKTLDGVSYTADMLNALNIMGVT